MDYKNGKIYKITDIAYTKMYIGSTCQPLTKRFSNHKADYKLWKNGKSNKVSSYDLFDEFGIENCKIELIEEFACENKCQLERKEGEHIKNNDCVNKVIVGRTQKEYYVDNKDNLKDKMKEYQKLNKDKIAEKKKEYNQVNKEKRKEYNRVNRERIVENQKKYNELNKDKRKEYREANKDKRKEYNRVNRDKINEYQRLRYAFKKNNKTEI